MAISSSSITTAPAGRLRHPRGPDPARRLADYNAFTTDRPLTEAVRALGADWAWEKLRRAGAIVGSEEGQQLARSANRHLPELRTHDRFGHRIDQVEFHPAYHELMRLIFSTETHSLAWTAEAARRPRRPRRLSYLWNQGENGVCCPMGMTFASLAALRHDQGMLARLAGEDPLAHLRSEADLRRRTSAALTVGMAMTEKQGGSDLRATVTTAHPATRAIGLRRGIPPHRPQVVLLVPMSDLFLTLGADRPGRCPASSRRAGCRTARATASRSSGSRTSAATGPMPSSEVEFHGLHAVMLGEEGHGIRTIVEMAHLTRLDFAIGSAGLMRQALSQAIHHVSSRRAFQRSLVDLPVMRNVVADLAVEAEALMWMGLRLALALDRAGASEAERLLSRIATPVPSTGPASAPRCSWSRPWSATAATASSRIT